MDARVETTTSTIGMSKRNEIRGFTLVELILVMAILALTMAFAAPSLSRSFRARNLEHEATRFLALTEYGRDEAVSQGVPMVLWIDVAARRFGVEPRAGFDGDEQTGRDYTLNPDVTFDRIERAASSRETTVMEFAPDGTLAPESIETLRLTDRFESAITIAQTNDRWGYEILKEAR
jgi:type II secretion system protein H